MRKIDLNAGGTINKDNGAVDAYCDDDDGDGEDDGGNDDENSSRRRWFLFIFKKNNFLYSAIRLRPKPTGVQIQSFQI